MAREADGNVTYPDLDEAEERLDYFYRTLERLDAAPGLPAGDRPAAGARWCRPPTAPPPRSREAMDDDFNTAAAVGHLYESFVLANKLLDEPKAAPKDVRRRTLARLRAICASAARRWGSSGAPPPSSCWRAATRLCARRGIDAAAVEARIADRAAARAAKDFARADEIRTRAARPRASS